MHKLRISDAFGPRSVLQSLTVGAAGRSRIEVTAALARLVEQRRLDRVTARAILQVLRGKLDLADLRQFLSGQDGYSQPDLLAGDDGSRHELLSGLACKKNLHHLSIKACIYAGKNNWIYKAYHKTLKIPVVVKFAVTPVGCHQLEWERNILCRKHHPCVIRLYDAGCYHGLPYLVLDYIGSSAADWVQRHGPVPVEQALRWAVDWADGLRAMSRAGWCHGDLSPANVLIDRRGRGVVADWGCGFRIGSASVHCATGGPAATWAFAAPERFIGQGDPRSDMYSLALTVYFLVQGRAVVESGDFRECLSAHRRLKLEPLHWSYPVPHETAQLLLRMASPDPTGRPARWDEVVRPLRQAIRMISVQPRGGASDSTPEGTA